MKNEELYNPTRNVQLPFPISGSQLISSLQEVTEERGYSVETMQTNETCSNYATPFWRMIGNGLSENRKLSRPMCNIKLKSDEDDNPNNKITYFWDEATPVRHLPSSMKTLAFSKPRESSFHSFLNGRLLWTAESHLVETFTYESFPLNVLKGDGHVYKMGSRFCHVGHRRPLSINNRFYQKHIEPEIDTVLSALEEKLRTNSAGYFPNSPAYMFSHY